MTPEANGEHAYEEHPRLEIIFVHLRGLFHDALADNAAFLSANCTCAGSARVWCKRCLQRTRAAYKRTHCNRSSRLFVRHVTEHLGLFNRSSLCDHCLCPSAHKRVITKTTPSNICNADAGCCTKVSPAGVGRSAGGEGQLFPLETSALRCHET